MAAFSSPLRNKAQSLSRSSARLVPAICLLLPLLILQNAAAQDVSAPENTQPLTEEGDLASLMVDGIDRFLLNEISKAAANRPSLWQLNQSSLSAFDESLKSHREQLAKEIGAHDSRLEFDAPTLTSSLDTAPEVSQNTLIRVLPIRWPVLSHPSPQGQGVTSVSGEGLLLLPRKSIIADIIVIPDADQSPEQICGLDDSLPPDQQVARILANRGFRVVVPQLISRQKEKRNGRASLTSREYLHRSAFELGRTLAGYEVQSTLSLVDWFSKTGESRPICVAGYGEGGMISLFAAALDTRISTTLVSGFFGPREMSWSEPLDRNFAGLLQHAGAAELAMMIAPRTLIIDASQGPAVNIPGDGGAPAQLVSPDPVAAETLLSDATARLEPLSKTIGRPIPFFLEKDSGNAVRSLCKHQGLTLPQDVVSLSLQTMTADQTKAMSQSRELRLLKQVDLHNQALLHESPFVRSQFMSKLDTSSEQKYSESVESYRSIFRKEVIGEFDQPLLPFNAQSRKSWETDKWTGHEVRLEVFPDVFAYGVLLLPKGLKPGEKRPVVVCQHGLEGRPTDIFLNDHPAYHDFAAKLCERGFITFSPQNPYIFTDRFRTLQRKAQPLGNHSSRSSFLSISKS